MYKKILGIVALIALVSIVIISIEQKDNDKQASGPNEYDVSGDTNVKGGAISPIESAGIEPGKMAPNFELETIDGETMKLSDLKGKKVILNFWATWCAPCRVEMPELQKFHEEYQDEVVIAAVNLTGSESKKEDVYEYIDKYKYTYSILLDENSQVSDTYQAISIPTTYFIGTNGKVQQPRKVGPMTYEFMEKMINSLD